MLQRTFYSSKLRKTFEESVDFGIRSMKPFRKAYIVAVTIFIPADNDLDFITKREIIKRTFEKYQLCIAFSVIAQPSAVGIAWEVWLNTHTKLLYKQAFGINYVLCQSNFGKMLFGFGMSANDANMPFREQVSHSFEQMQNLLYIEDFTMDHVIRQWNYIPRILHTTAAYGRLYQNYQIFNDIRQYYYGIYKRKMSYPAATGIGMDCGMVNIDFIALIPNSQTLTRELKNPNQVNAYQYGQEVLVGSPLKESGIKKAPLFERAKYIGTPELAVVFVSGTASIIGEQTIGKNDIAIQTNTTCDNISQLTNFENLEKAGIDIPQTESCYLRVYVKNIEDIPLVEQICQQKYGNIPILYVKADICRDDLLVEIEGEYALPDSFSTF